MHRGTKRATTGTIDYNILGRGKKQHEQQRQRQQQQQEQDTQAQLAGACAWVGCGSGLACQQKRQQQQQQQRLQRQQQRQPTTASDHQLNGFRLFTASEQRAERETMPGPSEQRSRTRAQSADTISNKNNNKSN
ncbi:hypothetical protein ACLKA6_018333 [Drosophila palustris]